MAKMIFEELGGTYIRQGDYFLPCLSLPAEKETKPIGVWGQRHLRYLKQHRKVLYTNLLTSGKLNSYLVDIDEQAEDTFLRLVKQIAEREGLTEQLKAENSMLWVQTMNSIRNRAMDIVNEEIMLLVICQNVNHFGTKNIITRRHLMKHQKVIIHGINLGIIICGIWIRFVYWHMILNLENESMTVKKLANCMRKK